MNTAAPSTLWKPATTMEPIPSESRPIPNGSIPFTGTAWSRRPPSSRSLRWIPSPPKSIPRAASKSVTSRKKLPSLSPRKILTSDAYFLDWAQYPITETETLQPPQQGYIVLFQDLRFAGILTIASRPSGGGLSRAVEIDKNLHVVGDVLRHQKGTSRSSPNPASPCGETQQTHTSAVVERPFQGRVSAEIEGFSP